MTKAIIDNKQTITSLEILEQINFFREKEGKKKSLKHFTLLNIIRDEFEEEINDKKILSVTYKDKKGEERPMYILSTQQGKQVLMRESKFVRRAVIHYIENLEKQLENNSTNYLQQQDREMIELKNRIEALEKAQEQNKINQSMTVSGYARVKGICLKKSICSNIGKMATHICKTEDIFIEKLFDSRYGFVNAYPMEVLEKVFSMYLNQ